MSGLYAEALQDYTVVVTINPADSIAVNNIGTILANLGRLSEALPFFEQAAKLDNRDAQQAAVQVRRELGLTT